MANIIGMKFLMFQEKIAFKFDKNAVVSSQKNPLNSKTVANFENLMRFAI